MLRGLLTRTSSLRLTLTVHIHQLILWFCKLIRNQVYSCLLGERNACNEWSVPDRLFGRNRHPYGAPHAGHALVISLP